MTDISKEAVDALTNRLKLGDDECCPFCGRDPYHYVDVGVGMQRAAVNCCDLGVALFQYGDEQLEAQVALRSEAANSIDALRAALDEAEAERDAANALLRETRSGLCAYTGGASGACEMTILRIDAHLGAKP